MEYNVHSDFSVEKHKETFINYLEVIIDENGKVMYAVPSHQEKLITLACDKLGVTREELNDMCPREYIFAFMECAVWNNFFIGDNLNKRQIDSLRILKEEKLYSGTIPI